MPHRLVTSRLGSHRLSCRSKLISRVPGQSATEVSQDVTLRTTAGGEFAASKHTHAQYGHEVIWTGGWLYPRLRYGKFIRRRAEPGEPAQIADRMTGLLPAYTLLLRRFMSVTPAGHKRTLGREAIVVRLGLEPEPRPAGEERRAARAWRRTITVKQLEGRALLDAETGVPLEVDVRSSWTFHPPAVGTAPASGIPLRHDANVVGTMDLTYSQRVSDLGKVASVRPPPEDETIDNPRLVRPELERQMLTGELPLEEPAGSGP